MYILILLGVIVALILLYILFLCVVALLISTKKEYTKHSAFHRFLLDSVTAVGLRLLRIRVHVSGTEKLPQGQKLLFVGNHCSNYDPIVTWHAFRPWKIAFISKPSNFKIPVFGRLIRKCCFMPIDRENPRNAIVTIQKAAALLQDDQVSVGVYPEGTRSKTGELLPFHNGVFKIAQKANVPVAVISVRHTNQIYKRTPWRSTDVYVDVLEVFSAQSVKETKTQMIGTAVRRLLEIEKERED